MVRSSIIIIVPGSCSVGLIFFFFFNYYLGMGIYLRMMCESPEEMR